VIAQWAIWRAGGACVPLCITHPPPELDYAIEDSGVSLIVTDAGLASRVEAICREREVALRRIEELLDANEAPAIDALPSVDPARMALLLYTSGTTGRPKAVVSTHAILRAQIEAVVQAWEIESSDALLHVLPLHHLHGILNALCAPLWAGAAVRFLPKFDADAVWRTLIDDADLSLLMGVPTMYARLVQRYDEADELEQPAMQQASARLRLAVSGSAALPQALLARFFAISTHTLLERYGMTELGMVLGNPLRGQRRAGFVGIPFPSVQVRLVDAEGAEVSDGEPGAIEVSGPGVFREYFGKPEATAAAFTEDGFFRTGDVAMREGGSYRILGRESVDILKTGGFKVSALEIEDVLRTHPDIRDCAVVGLPDEEWGQRVAVAIEQRGEMPLLLRTLREWAKERLAPYKVPSRLLVVDALPRNALGKVNKPEVTRLF
jgi:malonyl-CoA/methylmalonyl-CoA synthetase